MSKKESTEEVPVQSYQLIVHGGVSDHDDSSEDQAQRGAALDAALADGTVVLADGGSALAAVRMAVVQLEASGLFTAGRGAAPQRDGAIRMDASIMNSDGRAGAVIGVSSVESPVDGAFAVLGLDHTTLAGSAGDAVLAALGVATRPPVLATRDVGTCLREHREKGGGLFGTVGAVALDASGMLAAATSSGGYPAALPGRTGDSGVIGAGTYASQRCAVSCTGEGDKILIAGLAAALDGYLEAGVAAREAVVMAMRRLSAANGGGGFILVLPDGQAWIAVNMPLIRVRHTGHAERLMARVDL
jgi:beta-aspartyl-peptidase (threonine type)